MGGLGPPRALLLPKGSGSAYAPVAGGLARAAHRTPPWSGHWSACRAASGPEAERSVGRCEGDNLPPPPHACIFHCRANHAREPGHSTPARLAQPGPLPFSEAHFDGPPDGSLATI